MKRSEFRMKNGSLVVVFFEKRTAGSTIPHSEICILNYVCGGRDER